MVFRITLVLLLGLCLGFGKTYVAKIVEFKGRVDVIRKGSFKGIPVKDLKEKVLYVGDLLRTKSDGYAKLIFRDGSVVEVYKNSRLRIKHYVFRRRGGKVKARRVELKESVGSVLYKVERLKVRSFKVRTNTAIIGVKGTQFLVVSTPLLTKVGVYEGEVEVVQVETKRKIILQEGKEAIVPPTSPITVREFKAKLKERKKEGEEEKEEKEKEGLSPEVETSLSKEVIKREKEIEVKKEETLKGSTKEEEEGGLNPKESGEEEEYKGSKVKINIRLP